MIQITKWIDIKERVWCKKGLIPIFEWLSNEKDNLELLTHKKCEIRTDKGHISLFRERLK